MIVSDRVVTGLCPVQGKQISATAKCHPRSHAVVASVAGVLTVLLTIVSQASAQLAPPWHYDLRPGDHLTYSYSFHREMQSHDKDAEHSQTEVRFRSQVLVAVATVANITVGFQRNREAAELTQYTSRGKDKLAHELPDFQKRMQTRPKNFSEAMQNSPTGEPRASWEIARETPSHIIGTVHEILPLPPSPVNKGETWHSTTMPSLDLRWIDDQSIHGKSCHHIEAISPNGIKLSYWWSPESGVIEQIILDGTYTNYDTTLHETARLELESRARNEAVESWLKSPDTRQGALQSILMDPAIPISAAQLATSLTSGGSNDTESATSDTIASALILAVAVRRKISLAPDLLQNLQQSSSGLIQTQLQLRAAPAPPATDECHRPHPSTKTDIELATKPGTTFNVAPPTKDSPEIPYLFRVPLSYQADRPSPLLIYLSGGAGYAIDAVNTADDLVSQTDYLVLYPQAAALWWTPEVTHRFNAVLNDVLERYNVDRDRIYITGFSNGGTGALYYATLWPHRFAAVVTQMGAGQCNEQVKAGLANAKNLPLLLIHGEDDPLITPECSTNTAAALNELHPAITPELKILPKHGHDITLDSDDGLTLAFFKNKIRNPFPRTVDLTETDALANRAYWIEILDGTPGKSDLDARVKDDNTIEIHSHQIKRLRLHLRQELLPKPGDFRITWNGKKLASIPLRDVCSLPTPASPADPKLDLTDTREITLP